MDIQEGSGYRFFAYMGYTEVLGLVGTVTSRNMDKDLAVNRDTEKPTMGDKEKKKDFIMNGKVIGWQDKPSSGLRNLIDICEGNDRERLKETIGDGFYEQVEKMASNLDDQEMGLFLKVVAKMKRRNKKQGQTVNK